MGGETHQFQKSRNAVGQAEQGQSAESSVQFQKFARGKPRVESKVLGKETDLPAYLDVSGWRSKNESLPLGGRHEPKQHFYGSAFPRTVRPQEAKDFPAAHAQGKIADGHLFAIHLAQTPRLNGKTVRLVQ